MMMKNFSERLNNKQIINYKIVKEMRTWIDEQFPVATKQQKAKILAKQIHQLIDQNLPSFSVETKTSIRMQLVKERLTSRELTITAKHIVETSVQQATREEIESGLYHWLKEIENIEEHFIEQYVLYLYGETDSVIDEIAAAEMIEQQVANDPSEQSVNEKKMPYVFGAVAASILLIIPFAFKDESYPMENVVAEEQEIKDVTIERTPNELPLYLQYHPINEDRLRAYLQNRNSLLVEEPYFSTIIQVASEFNIHPLLLFAITGIEQGFVPKDDEDALLIANNPFNVYYSWQHFNTNILEASQIAARTIVNLSENRPEDVDPIQWINRKYAENENWWIGVNEIFQELTAYIDS